MRRIVFAIAATTAVLVLLLGFKTHGPTIATPPAAIAAGNSSATTPSTTSPDGTAAGTRTVTGPAYDTRYGPVQVRVTVTNGRMTDVTPVQLPQDTARDIETDDYAVPQLRQEALSAQSANIDMISGATFTSDGYIRSLQSALDQAKG